MEKISKTASKKEEAPATEKPTKGIATPSIPQGNAEAELSRMNSHGETNVMRDEMATIPAGHGPSNETFESRVVPPRNH